MPEPVHADRRRAESFGAVADEYDRYRPRYPQALIALLVNRPGLRVLDVGAGTGIASVQLAAAGADVLAVEPDARMAAVCRDKGIAVECNTFEQWPTGGRTFDLVVFGQSFHWVDPETALPKLAALLNPGGRLALLWNRVEPLEPSWDGIQQIYAGYQSGPPGATSHSNAATASNALSRRSDFEVERVEVSEDLTYSTEEWLGMVFTHSNHLILDPAAQTELRERLRDFIGTGGVKATNDALALICSLRQPSASRG
ncbi:MAG: class I SAM-dependent methyltransferase [Mycobacterium sp.]